MTGRFMKFLAIWKGVYSISHPTVTIRQALEFLDSSLYRVNKYSTEEMSNWYSRAGRTKELPTVGGSWVYFNTIRKQVEGDYGLLYTSPTYVENFIHN